MMYSFYQNLKDGELLSFMEGLHTFCTANAERFGLPVAALIALGVVTDAYKEKFLKVAEDGNHGHGDIAAKDEAKRSAITALEDFVNGNIRPNKDWSTEDLVNAGFPLPGSRSPQGKIEESPTVALTEKEGRLIKAHGQCKSMAGTGMPPWAESLEFGWDFVRADGTIPRAEETTHNVISFGATGTIEMDSKEKAREIAVYGRYHNHFPAPGPWSDTPATKVIT
ncbi:hypothetical protein FACS1894147_13070 [Spirochaetia bacterium]|nr:hypothetical protein FACS1894147_13070 [Spirochaetia bacterium]